MSLSSTTSRNDYTGNGNVDTYSYTFRIFDEDDLVVTVRDTDGVETTLTKSTHYTVSGVGDSGGGSVALVSGAFSWLDGGGDLLTGYALTIRRVVQLTQLTDIRNQGDFYPEIHEDQFDKMTMVDQQQQDEINRSSKMPETVSSSVFDPTLPASLPDNPGATVIVNVAGDGFDLGPTASAISAAASDAAAAAASAVAAAASEAAAAASAVAAAASAAAAQWTDVSYKTNADSPVSIVDASSGVMYSIDCTSGNVVVNLPAISSLTLSNPWSVGFKKTDSSANTLTINRNGTDTIEGSTSVVVSYQNQGVILIPDVDQSPDQWARISFGDLSTLYSPTINTPTIDVMNLDGQASTPSSPSAGFYKVYVKDDGKAYLLNSAGTEAGLGSGGGGGSLKFLERDAAPLLEVDSNLEVYKFEAALSQNLYAAIRVPSTYSTASQISMRGLFYCASSSGNILVKTQATLIRAEVDAISSTTNQRTSTNTAITLGAGTVNEPQKVVFDLTSTTGQINSVSVSAGDLIIVRLYRDTDTATGDVGFIQLATEVTFS